MPGEPRESASAWSLQLVGDSSEERALTEYKNLQEKFPAIFGARPPIVIKRQLGGRGLARWYQVRVDEHSRDAADALCSRLRSAGGACLAWISHAREKRSPLIGISESDQTISGEKP